MRIEHTSLGTATWQNGPAITATSGLGGAFICQRNYALIVPPYPQTKVRNAFFSSMTVTAGANFVYALRSNYIQFDAPTNEGPIHELFQLPTFALSGTAVALVNENVFTALHNAVSLEISFYTTPATSIRLSGASAFLLHKNTFVLPSKTAAPRSIFEIAEFVADGPAALFSAIGNNVTAAFPSALPPASTNPITLFALTSSSLQTVAKGARVAVCDTFFFGGRRPIRSRFALLSAGAADYKFVRMVNNDCATATAEVYPTASLSLTHTRDGAPLKRLATATVSATATATPPPPMTPSGRQHPTVTLTETITVSAFANSGTPAAIQTASAPIGRTASGQPLTTASLALRKYFRFHRSALHRWRT